MRVNERFDQLEEKVRRLEKEVAGLKKAGRQTATLEGEPIGRTAPEKKATGAAGTAEKTGKTRKTTTK